MGAQTNWWGFRLRVPPGHVPKPISVRERFAAGFVIATVLEIGCLIALLGWWATPVVSRHMLAVLLISVVPVVVFLFMPRRGLEKWGVAPWMVLAREKGSLSRTDVLIGMACFVILVLAQFGSHGSAKFALNAALADSAIALFFLLLQKRIVVQWKRWPVQIPEWLRSNLLDEERKKLLEQGHEETFLGEAIVPPDAGARPIYNLKIAAETGYPIGVRIPEDVLERLRGLNAGARGALYQTEPQAVVLMDRPPVGDTGRQEILRFCAQILSVARKHDLPPTALANMVLAFVQEAIDYKLDQESTSELPGGPYQEYGRFAVETLHDQVGDCECTSLLCASLLSYLGLRVALLWMVVRSTGEHHVAVGLEVGPETPVEGLDFVSAAEDQGKRYLYGETTLDGSTSPFGCFPESWETMSVEKITALDLPGLSL